MKQATGQSASGALDRAMSLIELLAGEIGPRRSASRDERLAAQLMRDELRREGVDARIEDFAGYATFGLPYGLIQAAGVAPSLLPARMRLTRSAIALLAGAALAGEGSLRVPLLSRALSRLPSGNVVATIEPSGAVRRTVCLMCHLDTSRSGVMFDPRFVGALGYWISAQSLAGVAQAVAEPAIGGSRRGRAVLAGIRAVLTAGLAVLAERELRGEDVAGANDNASGCAVAAVLAGEVAADPLESTRLVLLMTGCEESGTLGSQAFLREHDTTGWLFLNIDNVGGDGSVRFLRREGVLAKWDADAALAAVAEEIAGRRPDLRLRSEDSPAGLTYDSSPVLARGGRALTLSVQDGYIPDLHWPSDTYENVDPDGVGRTLEVAREMIAAIDAGGADL